MLVCCGALTSKRGSWGYPTGCSRGALKKGGKGVLWTLSVYLADRVFFKTYQVLRGVCLTAKGLRACPSLHSKSACRFGREAKIYESALVFA